MESLNLSQLNQYPLKGLTNRYCTVRVNTSNTHLYNLVDTDSIPSDRKDSMDEDSSIQMEGFLYSAGKQVYVAEIAQPTFLNQQSCLNFENNPSVTSAIHCLTGFSLPKNYNTQASKLSIPTGIILVYDGPTGKQTMKIYSDRGEELHYECKELSQLYQDRIIWVQSKQFPLENECFILLILGYQNCRTSIFSLEINQPNNKNTSSIQIPQLHLLHSYQLKEISLFSEIYLRDCPTDNEINIDVWVCLTSIDGELSLITLNFKAIKIDHPHSGWELTYLWDKNNIETIKIQKKLSQPKFIIYKKGEEDNMRLLQTKYFEEEQRGNLENKKLHLLIPIQNGKLKCFQNIDQEGLKKCQDIELRADNQEIITAFDAKEIHLISSQGQESLFQLFVIYYNGIFEIFELSIKENEQNDEIYQANFQFQKQLNSPKFFLNASQFSMKSFIFISSDDEIELYEVSSYHIN